MRILLLTHTFNSLAQKIYAELKRRGHVLSVEYDISDQVTQSAVDNFKPDLLIAPFLKSPIPESVWKNVLSFIIHPGPPGDRGPSSLDWAILNEEKTWGVTIIQATDVMDGGPIWAWKTFPMRTAQKGSIYRREISAAALESLLEALTHIDDFNNDKWMPTPAEDFIIQNRISIKQADRRINWQDDTREMIINKINSADGSPGLLSRLADQNPESYLSPELYLYDAKEFPFAIQGPIGKPLGICDHGVIVNTSNGPIAIGHLKEKSSLNEPSFKKPARYFFEGLNKYEYPRVRLEIHDEAAFIYFNFYNGAMGIKECRDLHEAYIKAKKLPFKIIVLKSEGEFFSNGIHLNEIEFAAVPADYAWNNINAMNDLIEEIITTEDKLTIAILDSNASAGGVLLARAHDLVIASRHIILNPHYKNMGNLYGSEFWTYLFPKYLGATATKTMMSKRLPMEAQEAKEIGLINEIIDEISDCSFNDKDWKNSINPKLVSAKLVSSNLETMIESKKASRYNDELKKSLRHYGEEELDKMKDNFYGFDPSFHLARYNFVRHIAKSKTPLHIAIHRETTFSFQ